MLCGEFRGRDSPDAAVRTHLVVVTSPASALGSSLRRAVEPMLVQTFVPETPVEALYVGVLRWAAWLDQDVFNLV